jgi:hypothetical protein
MASPNEKDDEQPASSPRSPNSISAAKRKSYQHATGRFQLICTFEAIFIGGDSEQDIKTARILKTLVSNARSKRDPKFHTIHLENPRIHQYITQNDAAMDALKLIGFVEKQDLTNEETSTRSLWYAPEGVQQLQEGSRLESLLEEKLVKLQKVDTCTAVVKQHKMNAKQKKLQEEEARKNNLSMFQEDRERQKERQERLQRLAELDTLADKQVTDSDTGGVTPM